MILLSALLPAALALATSAPAPRSGSAPVFPPEYYVLNLGTLGPKGIGSSPGSVPLAIALDGTVVGASVIDEYSESVHAFRRDRDGVQHLLPLPGDPHSQACAIDGLGRAVGISYTLGRGLPRAVVWNGGVPNLLGTFEPHDANAQGLLVGEQSADGTPLTTRPVLWNGSGLVDLGDLGGSQGAATAIDGNRVVGLSTDAAGTVRAFHWANGVMVDLGTLGGASSRARDINGRGQVVGTAETAAGDRHAFLFKVTHQGQVTHRTDLGTLGGPSHAFGINDLAIVVGTSNGRAFRWRRDEGMVDLNDLIPADSGWQLAGASAINLAGLVVGHGMHHGLPRGFLLVPLRPRHF